MSVLRSVAGIGFGIAVVVTPAGAQTRGELLYSTHCAACHTTQMHWRASRAVTDWGSLRAEVRKWQLAASLTWSEDDTLEVARYLNESIYHFVDTASKGPMSGPGRTVETTAQPRRPGVPIAAAQP